jgi:hypothetical protein
MISTFKIKTIQGVHVQPYSEMLLGKGEFVKRAMGMFKRQQHSKQTREILTAWFDNS